MSLIVFGLCLVASSVTALGEDFTVQNSCPPGAVKELGPEPFRIYQGRTCFLFTTTSKATYADAEKACQAHNGTLAMPKSNLINRFLEEEIEDLGFKEPLWIGIDDRASEGDFVYADGTEVDWDNFNNFLFGALNIVYNGVQDCVAIDHRYGLWNRYRCEPTLLAHAHRPFICQYNIE